jgi:hypothetical protein
MNMLFPRELVFFRPCMAPNSIPPSRIVCFFHRCPPQLYYGLFRLDYTSTSLSLSVIPITTTNVGIYSVRYKLGSEKNQHLPHHILPSLQQPIILPTQC